MSAIYGNYSYSSYLSRKYGPTQAALAKYNAHTTYADKVTGASAYQTSAAAGSGSAASLMGAKSAADAFKSAASAFTQSTQTPSYTAASSNAAAVGVSRSTTSALGTRQFTDVRLDVSQVATAQKNMGTVLSSKQSDFEAGAYSFSIDSRTATGGTKTSDYNINVTETDDALSIQQKMADAINGDKNAAVRASVITDEKTGVSRLALEAKETGTQTEGEDAFQVRDTGAPGARGLVERMGVGSSDSAGSVKAQNARYSVNGGFERSSRSNTVDLGYGVSATLKTATEKTVTISSKVDTSKTVDAAKDFAKAYNDLLDTAKTNGTEDALRSLQTLLRNYSEPLSAAGITSDANGRLSVDEDALSKAAENGSLKNLLNTGNNYGLGGQLTQKSDALSRNPMQLADNTSSRIVSAWTYGGSSDLWNSLYSAMFGGQLVNSWI